MMNKRNAKDTAVSKMVVLSVIAIVIVLFILFAFASKYLYTLSPILVLGIFAIFFVYYTSDTVSLLYDFYDADRPFARYIPVVCELFLLDIKYRKLAATSYIAAVIAFVLSKLPYNVKAIFGSTFATNISFYLLLLMFIFLIVAQILIGMGMIATINDIRDDWFRIVKTDIGAISKFGFFCFIPLFRFYTIFALRKPLDTLVRFQQRTVNNDGANEVFLSDEDNDDDDSYDEED